MSINHKALDQAFGEFWARFNVDDTLAPLTRIDHEASAILYYIAFSYAFDQNDRTALEALLVRRKPLPPEFMHLIVLLLQGPNLRGGPKPRFTTAERRNIHRLMLEEKSKTAKNIEDIAEDLAKEIKNKRGKSIGAVQIRRIWAEFKAEPWSMAFVKNNHNSA